MTTPLSDPAVAAIVEYHEAKSPGTPIRAVLEHAAALGYRVVPPASATSARYLRLVSGAASTSITLYVDGAKLTSNGKALRAFALGVPGGHETPRDVQYPFDSVDPTTVLAAFRDQVVRGGAIPSTTNEAVHPQSRPMPRPAPVQRPAPTPVTAWRKPVPDDVHPVPAARNPTSAPHRGRRVAGLAGVAALAAIIIAALVGGHAPTRPASNVASSSTSSASAARDAGVVSEATPTTTQAAVVVPAPLLGMTCPAGGSVSSPDFGHQITATGPYTVTIDYGDGDRYTNDSQHLDAIFTHTYRTSGSFTVSAVLTDTTGQSANATCAYVWAPPAPAPVVQGNAGGSGTGSTGGSGSGDTYTNSDGNQIPGPVSAPAAPPGATAQCRDGTYSLSQHRSGTCSSHGGVATWINGGPPG